MIKQIIGGFFALLLVATFFAFVTGYVSTNTFWIVVGICLIVVFILSRMESK